MKDIELETLVGLLGLLRGLKWAFWNYHWLSKGKVSYADHLLFERLYSTQIDEQIDTLAEKIVAYNSNILKSPIMRSAFNRFLDTQSLETKSLVQSAFDLETRFQLALKNTYTMLKEANELSLGMDDYLMATANERETVLYLLKQRLQ